MFRADVHLAAHPVTDVAKMTMTWSGRKISGQRMCSVQEICTAFEGVDRKEPDPPQS